MSFSRRHVLRRLCGSAAALALPACGGAAGESLLIGTTLDTGSCAELTARFLASRRGRPAPRIGWLRVAPSGWSRLVDSGRPLDLIAGGTPSQLDRLARQGRLDPSASWRMLRRVQTGLAIRSDVLQERALTFHPATTVASLFAELTRPAMAGLVAIDDPRRDADSLALAADRLSQGPTWADGYADLIHLAALAAPAGVRPGATLARLARRELAVAPARRPLALSGDVAFRPLPHPSVEGIAVLAHAPSPDLARAFLDAVALDRDRGTNEPAHAPPPGDAASRDLLATLLGATLVDAQPELVAAREALERLPDPNRAATLDAFLVEPPPWPPASIQRLATRGRRDLIEALAAQITPDLERRYWLLQSWEAPATRIDGALLADLAAAVDGALLAEPRLRTWLEAEWRAWTRQRGRRVARQARLAASSTPTPLEGSPA